jgi:hypothetical protein
MAMIALMMEAARTSETLVNFYQTSRRYNAEDSHLRSHRRENLIRAMSFMEVNCFVRYHSQGQRAPHDVYLKHFRHKSKKRTGQQVNFIL